MENNRIDDLVIENARIIFRNFSGKETRYNRAGDRNFCVIIDDPKEVEKLSNDGWYIRTLAPKEEYDKPLSFMSVNVKFNRIPPKVFVITRHGKRLLDEDDIDELDYTEIQNVDLIVRPYNWDVNGKSGVTAYLKSMYVTIAEDVLAKKYAEEEGPGEDF